ncbi:uncharacterized protein BDZ99DRAFT_568740 [Mytilinidion resinicola]|uniref:RNA polymerase II assembly factor Rtp1 C-terminal domain-containing protein n=1 Tax=Mytilinidion resinicola TaxID=574789 RepID=A0A6A6Z014_9PEZI|nr:uncharacterized protein BDZ99DRAFT_568740 [Mytilinidion resinicola]KAF2813567.1 hypothetical protein BDZ99DRAFT_568740 [Mytilinidion resinicola]
MGALEDAVRSAADFIRPFMNDEGSLAQKQNQLSTLLVRPKSRSKAVQDALSHLEEIHDRARSHGDALYDGALVAMVYGLIDLVVLVGIIPCIRASTISVRRPQSVLLEIRSMPSNDIPLLQEVIGRTSVDKIVPLLPVFNTAAPWLKTALSQSLSLIPLRPHGLRQLLRLLSNLGSSGTAITQEAVTQVTKLILLHPPPPATRDEQLHKIAPQLWDLLPDEASPEMSKAAGQIIASILNLKSLGAPGTVGWKLFAQPLLDAFEPKFATPPPGSGIPSFVLAEVLVSEPDLLKAVKSLSVVTTAHPHPGLAKRLISPIILPLWGLLSYAKSRQISGRIWEDTTRSILLHYFQIAGSLHTIDSVASNLLYDGEPAWTYGPGSEGGIEIRRRPGGRPNIDSIPARMEDLEARISTFVDLLQASSVRIAVAQNAMKRWLSSASTTSSLTNDLDGLEGDVFGILLNAALCNAIVQKLAPEFERHPKHTIELARTLLEDFVEGKKAEQRRETEMATSTYTSLRSIVQGNSSPVDTPASNPEEETIILLAMSILTTLIGNPDFKRTVEADDMLGSVARCLRSISSEGPREGQIQTTAAINNAAENLLSILSSTQTSISPFTDPLAHLRSTLSTALSELQSNEPPICAHALSTIKNLASSADSSHIIDIPSSTHAIISLSLSHPDSYVYTAAIPPLISLAALHPALVTNILKTTFLDADESTLKPLSSSQPTHAGDDGAEIDKITASLDLRLRVGETLSEILSAPSIWARPTPDATRALHSIIDASLTLASRRGPLRPDTFAARDGLAAAQARSHREAEEAWGGDVPSLSSLSLSAPASDPGLTSHPHDSELVARIVNGWQDTGMEEDIRMRASALAILGKAFEARWGNGITQDELDRAIEIVLGCLVLERGVERAILRRAAVLVVLGVLKGLESGSGGVRLAVEKWAEVERVLKRVGADDEDGLVRGYVGVVLERLETWRREVWFGMRGGGGEQAGLGRLTGGLEGGLRGLAIKPGDGKGGQGRSMVEEVE